MTWGKKTALFLPQLELFSACRDSNCFKLWVTFWFDYVGKKRIFDSKIPQIQTCGTRSSSGWVLTYVRTFKRHSSHFWIWLCGKKRIFYSIMIKKHKIKFFGRGVPRDEFLHNYVRTFRMIFQPFFNFVIRSQALLLIPCSQKTRKNEILWMRISSGWVFTYM